MKNGKNLMNFRGEKVVGVEYLLNKVSNTSPNFLFSKRKNSGDRYLIVTDLLHGKFYKGDR